MGGFEGEVVRCLSSRNPMGCLTMWLEICPGGEIGSKKSNGCEGNSTWARCSQITQRPPQIHPTLQLDKYNAKYTIFCVNERHNPTTTHRIFVWMKFCSNMQWSNSTICWGRRLQKYTHAAVAQVEVEFSFSAPQWRLLAFKLAYRKCAKVCPVLSLSGGSPGV